VPYLLAAADIARRGWAESAVIDLYSRALELTDDDELARQIRLQRGVALVELHDYDRASEELRALVPELDGPEKLDALIALGIAEVWTERDAEAIAVAEQALELAKELGDPSGIPAALAALSEGLAMRGEEGDLDQALELGERSLELWVPGARKMPHTHLLHLHANLTAWRGEYERSAELSSRTRELATDMHSADSLLRGGGLEAVAHVGLGRHERAIAIYDELFELARDHDRPVHVLLNYSSIVFREVYDLEEARTRTAQAVELSAQFQFGMPKQFAGSDMIQTYLLAGDIGAAQLEWPKRWERAAEATAWTTWLIAGRLMSARAEIALEAETPGEAAEFADRAIAIARRTRRRKYEARSLFILGQALARLGRHDDAFEALHSAVQIADRIVSPYARWNARAALGRTAYALGRDDEAAKAYGEAKDIVDAFAAGLAPQRQATLAQSPVVQEIRSA
jgi:tetratricopeptide (TPR) repeat protein